MLAGATLAVAAGYGALSIWRHARFLTHGHDLGIFDQAVWELSRFETPATTVRLTTLPNLFGDHFTPILLLVVPGYWIASSPIVLLVAQALLLAAVVPLGYLLARQLGVARWPAVLLGAALGAHPGLATAVLFDFHEIAFAPALVLATVLLAERRRWGWYWMALAGWLAIKESLALHAALYGVTLALRGRRRVGAATFAVGIVYFLVVTGLVIPTLGGQPYYYWRHYAELGDSPPQMLAEIVSHPLAALERLVSHPEKRRTIHLMFGSFAYLPLMSWTTWPVQFLTLAERFWGIRPEVWMFRFQYQAMMTAVFFVATLYVLHDLTPRLRRPRAWAAALAVVLAFGTAWASARSGIWRDTLVSPPPETTERWRQAVRRIPPGARVAAQSPFVPHLSRRLTIYQFPRVRDAEYVVLDPRADAYPLTSAEIHDAQAMLAALGWDLAWRADTTTVFRRTPTSRTPPETLP